MLSKLIAHGSTRDEAIRRMKRALAEYRSQTAHCDYAHHLLGLNAYRAAPLNDPAARYVEAFCMLPLRDYAALIGSIAAPVTRLQRP